MEREGGDLTIISSPMYENTSFMHAIPCMCIVKVDIDMFIFPLHGFTPYILLPNMIVLLSKK